MGFFDDLGKKVTDAGQKTMQKAQEMSEVARINSLISQNESKINNVYYQIGKLFVSIYGNDCREEFAGMVATVAELEQQNATYKKQIQDVKGIQHCEKCGAEVAMGVAFCSSCGAAMPKVDKQPSDDVEKCPHCGSYDGGGTNIEAGLRNAQSMLERTNAKKKIIVLMSDGEPNDGLVDEELIEYAAEIKKTGTIIYTIGFFESLSEKSYAQYLMEQIASDGCHYEVADADQLKFFFEDMADQINGQKYIYVRIACPVDVSVSYDGETLDSSEKNLNARTSFGTLTFEENSEKLEAGIDDRVKVLRLKEGTDYDLKIVGTGHGIMNYTIGFMDENGEYSDLRKFKNIKITRKTRIDTGASNSDSSILNIDEDGDGKYDIRLKAEANGYGEEITTSNWIIYVIIGAVAFVMLDIIAIVIYTKKKKRKGE